MKTMDTTLSSFKMFQWESEVTIFYNLSWLNWDFTMFGSMSVPNITRISPSSSKRNVKSCTWHFISSCSRRGWWPTSWEAALQEKAWHFWWTTSWTWASNAPLSQNKATSLQLHQEDGSPANGERWSFSSNQHR